VIEVNLREYCDEIKGLIERGSYDKAIAICQHILRHYPKYVEAYRLLGEACLEKGDYLEAEDSFQRVLSADPEDFTARVGLSIICDERGSLEEAIWQMERAFDLFPGNAEVRSELRHLYKKYDGVERPKIGLTPGALGRFYAKGELLQEAIEEFRKLLEKKPELIDVQLALAESLWRSGQRLEAAEVCSGILEKLPNCLKANLILGEIQINRGYREEGEAHLMVAQALDPENEIAQELFGPSSPLPLRTVKIPRLEFEEEEEIEPIPPMEIEVTREPAWLRELLPEEVAPPPEFAEVAKEPVKKVRTIEECESRLAIQPDDHEARLALAQAYRREGNLEASIEHYEKLVQASALLEKVIEDLKDEENLLALRLLGDAYLKAGRLEEALEAYRKAYRKALKKP
jgi:tetratricopeptide (TPR) repeat protein